MVQKNGDTNDKKRIAELEAEVQRLRQEAASRSTEPEESGLEPQQSDAHQNVEPDPDPQETNICHRAGDKDLSRSEGALFAFSKPRAIAVGVLVAAVALAAFFVVYSALTSGFDSFAHSAAKIFVPDDQQGQHPQPATTTPHTPTPGPEETGPATPAAPQVPGL